MQEACRELRSLIFRKFDTETACAEALGWNKQRLNRYVRGLREPRASDVVAMAKVLDVRPVLLADIFLRMLRGTEETDCHGRRAASH